MSVYPFIEAERAEQCHVKPACELLEVSRAASYQWARHIPSKHDLDDRALKPRITEIHQTSRGTYGAPRVHAALRRDGVATSTKRVAPADGRAGPGRATQAPVQADHDRRSRPGRGGRPAQAGLRTGCHADRPGVVLRHHLRPHVGRVALPRGDPRCAIAPSGGVGDGRSHADLPRVRRARHGRPLPPAGCGAGLPLRSRQPVHLGVLPSSPGEPRDAPEPGRPGAVLGQRRGRIVLVHPQGGAGVPPSPGHSDPGTAGGHCCIV